MANSKRMLSRSQSDFFFYASNERNQITYISDSVLAVLGCYPEEIYNQSKHRDKEGYLETILQAIQQKRHELESKKDHPSFEVVVSDRSGAIKQLLISEIILRGPTGETLGIHGFAIDTTEEHIKEEDLSTNQQLLSVAKRLAQFGHWNLDLITGELQWSEEIYTMFGIEKTSFGASYEAFLDCLPCEDKELVNTRFSDALETASSYEVEHHVIRQSDKKTRVVREFCEFICDSQGRPIRALGAVQDITHSKKAELEKIAQEKTRYTSLIETIDAVAATLAFRDPYTAGHQKRVSQIAVRIAEEMGIDEKVIEGIKLGAMLHDIGKVMVPMEILNRPGRLSKPEFEIIKTHPNVGYDIVEKVEFIWPIGEMILQHHERLDGSGYPNGLKGDEIILEARIIAVADVLEAITSHRPYRPALGLDKAIEVLCEGRGTAFDATVIDTCMNLVKNNQLELGH